MNLVQWLPSLDEPPAVGVAVETPPPGLEIREWRGMPPKTAAGGQHAPKVTNWRDRLAVKLSRPAVAAKLTNKQRACDP